MAYVKTNWANGQAPAINAENLNKIEEGIEAAHNKLPSIPQAGKISLSVPASQYKDYAVVFDEEMASIPAVITSFAYGGVTGMALGENRWAIISATSKTGFTVRVFNDTTSSMSWNLHWIAVSV